MSHCSNFENIILSHFGHLISRAQSKNGTYEDVAAGIGGIGPNIPPEEPVAIPIMAPDDDLHAVPIMAHEDDMYDYESGFLSMTLGLLPLAMGTAM